MKNKFYISTPIYYPNSKPHLGTLYSTMIADVFAKWNKILGKEVFFLTGLDEHGQKLEEAAEKAGKDCQVFVDSMVPAFKETWKLYGLEYDFFVRTSSEQHKKSVSVFIKKLIENGDVYKGSYQGFYCTPCETFVNPEEKSQDKPSCPECKRELKVVSEESYFFRLSKYQDKLLDFFEKNKDFLVPKGRQNEVVSFVKSGLKDLSISRKSVKWGIPFPDDSEHTVYVWGDALTNYISSLGFGLEDDQKFKKFWPCDLHVLAKDIVRFHAVYWPAMLMSAGIEPPLKELIHGYILVDKEKMSKSLGNAIDPKSLAEKYGTEEVKYYLSRHMAVTQDGNFDIDELENSINSDLANNLGNLLNRTVSLAKKNKVEKLENINLSPEALSLKDKSEKALSQFKLDMQNFQLHQALANLFKFVSQVNSFFHEQEPWKLAKSDPEKFSQVIYAACSSLNLIGILLLPILPKKMKVLLTALGQNPEENKIIENYSWNKSFYLSLPEKPLFSKIEKEELKEKNKVEVKPEKKDNFASFEDFLKIKVAVGQIKSVNPVKNSEKLYQLKVDFGALGEKQVISGIAKNYTVQELLEKKAAFVINLKPRKIMGLESQAMIMAASDSENFTITCFDRDNIKNGTILS